jgi:teichuronic acid biosynthesis glycosyltransferase TuaC
MRVLVVTKDFPAPDQPEGGIVVLRQTLALAQLGYDCRVVRVVPYAPGVTAKWRAYRAVPDRYAIEGIPVETIRAIFPPRMVGMEYLPLQVSGPLQRIVREFAPDLMQAHYVIPCGQLAVGHRVPAIVTAHGSDTYDWAWRRPGLRRAAIHALRNARTVIAVSEFIRQKARALFERDVRVVYNGADEGTFFPCDRTQARGELGIDNARFVIAFAGRPTREKGAFDLVDAAARMRVERPLILIAGAPATELGTYVRQRGVDARQVGMLDHARLARIIAASNVFALPSYREGLPLSVCEAMLCARAIVATPVGGIPEIVAEGEAGFLVPPGDVDRLSERLELLSSNAELTARMGDAAYRFAREHLTWRVNAQSYDRLYRAALGIAAA